MPAAKKRAANQAARRAFGRGERTAARAGALSEGSTRKDARSNVRAAKADKRVRVNLARRQRRRGETTKGAVRATRREERQRVKTAKSQRATSVSAIKRRKKERQAGVKRASAA